MKGKFIITQGKVYVVRNNNLIPAKVGVKVFQGDIIKTGDNGVAVISIKKGQSEFEVQQNSEFEIEEVESGKENFYFQKLAGNGQVTGYLKKNNKLYIRYSNSNIGCRGDKVLYLSIWRYARGLSL